MTTVKAPVPLNGLLADQFGVVAGWQASLAGVTPRRLRTLVSSGSWVRLLPGVYGSAAHDLRAADARTIAASLWGGPGAVIAGLAAARWWRLTNRDPAEVTLVVPTRRNLRLPSGTEGGLTVLRRRLPPEDQCTHRGLRVTTRPYKRVFQPL